MKEAKDLRTMPTQLRRIPYSSSEYYIHSRIKKTSFMHYGLIFVMRIRNIAYDEYMFHV